MPILILICQKKILLTNTCDLVHSINTLNIMQLLPIELIEVNQKKLTKLIESLNQFID